MTLISTLDKAKLILLSTVLCAGAASADVYKWIDKDGKVQYSDSPPISGEGKKLKQTTKDKDSGGTAPASGAAAAKPAASIADKELEFRKRKMEQEEAEKKQKAEKERNEKNKEYCVNLRGDLKAHNDGRRITKYNENGERIFLDDAARAKSKADLEAAIAKDCK